MADLAVTAVTRARLPGIHRGSLEAAETYERPGPRYFCEIPGLSCLVASEGFEPPNAMQSDLQSDPFGRLGNSPGRSVHMYSSDRRR